MDDVEKSDYAKKGKEWAEELGKTVEKTAESVSKQGEQLQRSQLYKSVSEVRLYYISTHPLRSSSPLPV